MNCKLLIFILVVFLSGAWSTCIFADSRFSIYNKQATKLFDPGGTFDESIFEKDYFTKINLSKLDKSKIQILPKEEKKLYSISCYLGNDFFIRGLFNKPMISPDDFTKTFGKNLLVYSNVSGRVRIIMRFDVSTDKLLNDDEVEEYEINKKNRLGIVGFTFDDEKTLFTLIVFR